MTIAKDSKMHLADAYRKIKPLPIRVVTARYNEEDRQRQKAEQRRMTLLALAGLR